MINWNAIIVEAHGTAILKGWWDKPVTQASQLCNLHCELSEAFQEYRNGHEINEIYCKAAGCGNALICKERCEDYQPMGVPVELADFCLWVCDWMGNGRYEYIPTLISANVSGFDALISCLHKEVERIKVSGDESFTLCAMLDIAEAYCIRHHIPLKAALLQKMEYNRKRPYRHGGKRV